MSQIIEKNIKEIVPYEKNPRMNDNAVDAVAKSIEQFGWKVPIVIDKNNVIVTGHTRYKAALKLGIENYSLHRCKRSHGRSGEGLPDSG